MINRLEEGGGSRFDPYIFKMKEEQTVVHTVNGIFNETL